MYFLIVDNLLIMSSGIEDVSRIKSLLPPYDKLNSVDISTGTSSSGHSPLSSNLLSEKFETKGRLAVLK